MSRRTQENLVALVLLLVFVGFLVVGMSYPPKARLVPVPLAIVSILLITLQLVLQNLKTNINLTVDTMELFAKQGGGQECEEEEREMKVKSSSARKEWEALGLVALFIGMILLIGMLPSVFLYIFGYFILIGKARLLTSLLYSGITVGIIYLLFVNVLQVTMYKGVLGSLL